MVTWIAPKKGFDPLLQTAAVGDAAALELAPTERDGVVAAYGMNKVH
jgi:hypothetical protein